MVINWGSDSSSLIAGRSVHNHGSERIWAEVNRVSPALYKDLLDFLEGSGTLNSLDEFAGFAICLYSSDQCHISWWNYHGMRTVGHQTPMAMWYTGLLTAPKESVVTNWQTYGIFIYRDFHSTKWALWLVDSWSHTPNQIQMYPYRETIHSCYLCAEYNSTFVCFCHMIALGSLNI